jgi:hypothetical protein
MLPFGKQQEIGRDLPATVPEEMWEPVTGRSFGENGVVEVMDSGAARRGGRNPRHAAWKRDLRQSGKNFHGGGNFFLRREPGAGRKWQMARELRRAQIGTERACA